METIYLQIFYFFALVQQFFAAMASSCAQPLGLNSGNITNEQFWYGPASYHGGYEPYNARLDKDKCYCTHETGRKGWFKSLRFTIDLRQKYKITRLAVQRGILPQYGVGEYMRIFTSVDTSAFLPYTNSEGSEDIKIPELKNDREVRYIDLTQTYADKIKFQLQGSDNHHCIRMEIYGCRETEADAKNKEENGTDSSIIIVLVLLLLLFLVLLLLGYMFRKKLKKWTQKKHNYSKASTGTDANKNDVILQPSVQKHYEIVDDGESIIYAEPGLNIPDASTGKRESMIYYGSAIYAPTYENPYKSTVSSCIYYEPDKFLSSKPLIREFPRAQLKFRETIGMGQFGEVRICEASGLDEIYGHIGHGNSWGLPDTALVAVKMLKSVDSEVEEDFMKEVEVMAALKDENVVRLLGICSDHPKLMVVEYMENGDLNQFLSTRRPASEGDGAYIHQVDIDEDVLTVDQLIHMSQQISAGMKHLHSLDFIHRDLATRNCLVGHAYKVKIADFGMSRDIYSEHYYRVEGKACLPIRWMAPECIFYGKFTMATDVWSFGVTLWEIFSFARQSPYSDMTDPEVIEAACEHLQNDRDFPYIRQPEFCPNEIYRTICWCWAKDPRNRPTFTTLSDHLHGLCSISEVNI